MSEDVYAGLSVNSNLIRKTKTGRQLVIGELKGVAKIKSLFIFYLAFALMFTVFVCWADDAASLYRVAQYTWNFFLLYCTTSKICGSPLQHPLYMVGELSSWWTIYSWGYVVLLYFSLYYHLICHRLLISKYKVIMNLSIPYLFHCWAIMLGLLTLIINFQLKLNGTYISSQ